MLLDIFMVSLVILWGFGGGGGVCQLLYDLNFNCIENYTWEKSNIFQKILLNVCEVKRVNQDSK